MIDRPDEVRRVENFKRLQLTDFKIDIPKLAKKKALKEALESNGETSSIDIVQQTATDANTVESHYTHSF